MLGDVSNDVQLDCQRTIQVPAVASPPTKQPHLYAGDGTDGYPTRADWNACVEKHSREYPPGKFDRALITQAMYNRIVAFRIDPESKDFKGKERKWVNDSFDLVRLTLPSTSEGQSTVEGVLSLHAEGAEGETMIMLTQQDRPVATREQLYDIIVRCHAATLHGGRDKTNKEVSRFYSGIPKLLIVDFIKLCPTCELAQKGTKTLPEDIYAPRMVGGELERRAIEPGGSNQLKQRRKGRKRKKRANRGKGVEAEVQEDSIRVPVDASVEMLPPDIPAPADVDMVTFDTSRDSQFTIYTPHMLPDLSAYSQEMVPSFSAPTSVSSNWRTEPSPTSSRMEPSISLPDYLLDGSSPNAADKDTDPMAAPLISQIECVALTSPVNDSFQIPGQK